MILTAETAGERAKWMEFSERETQEVLRVTGILLGGYIDIHKFAIKIKDFRYAGAVSQDAQDQIKKITLGAKVHAMIKQTSKYKTKAVSEPKVTYSLESIVEAPQEKELETRDLFE